MTKHFLKKVLVKNLPIKRKKMVRVRQFNFLIRYLASHKKTEKNNEPTLRNYSYGYTANEPTNRTQSHKSLLNSLQYLPLKSQFFTIHLQEKHRVSHDHFFRSPRLDTASLNRVTKTHFYRECIILRHFFTTCCC